MSASAAERLNAGIWHTFDAYAGNASVRWAPPARRVLMAEGTRAAHAYGTTGSAAAALDAVDARAWAEYLKRLALAVVPDGWRMIEAAIEAVIGKVADDIATRAAVRYLRENGAQRTEQITNASRRIIGEQIRIGVTKGETNQEIAERLTGHYKTMSEGRAATIARTEVHAAANYGSLSAAVAAPIPLEKAWLATPDKRTRDTHKAAHGQRREVTAFFNVGGAHMMYPGDSANGAGADLTANCRCSMGYRKIGNAPAPARRPRRAA